MRTSNLHFNPFQTIIRDCEGHKRYFVSTAFSPSGFLDWEDDDLYHWETMVFPYDDESGNVTYDIECACSRCDSHEEAIYSHMFMVERFTFGL
ncbi:hypothetical protein IKF30_02960 [Candidatus Saccharibacteria bacterium]|nr:hypothetical protein [Candidatus Saccharibacteria bacterium]